jgi:L-alanine-DL-glutamate epimerase-like enolase superfamily enzyme
MGAVPMQMHVVLERLTLKAPFRISGYTFTEVPVVVVTLHRGGARGRGEAAGVYYLNDTPDRIVEIIETHRTEIERGLDREALSRMLPPGGARNALDCALWELEANAIHSTVWRQAGLETPAPRVTTFTLSADDPATVGRAADQLSGARALKLKLNGDIEADIARVRAVRIARPDVWLGVDANQGYSLDALRTLLPALIDAHVQLLEQPLLRGHEAELERFDSPIPVAADESVQGFSDVASLVGRFDVVNIKLDKCGGLTEALRIVEEARRLGLQVMVGNMLGTSWAMAPAFVIAQLCDYVDLDGPTFIARDRNPGVRYDNGSIHCGDDVWGS